MSLRSKLVMLLVLVGMLPLLVSLVGIIQGGRNVRAAAFGSMLSAVTSAEARGIRYGLADDLEIIGAVLQTSRRLDLLAGANEMPAAERNRLDFIWPSLTADRQPLADILDNPLSEALELARGHDQRIAEIQLTDRYGQLVAATGKTDDYYQADEDWWILAYNNGKGRMLIMPPQYDPHVGVVAIDLCVPIRRDGKVIGIARETLECRRWFGVMTSKLGDNDVRTAVVNPDGTVAWNISIPRGEMFRAGRWPMPRGGWRLTPDGNIESQDFMLLVDKIGSDDDVVEMPQWRLVMYVPRDEVLGPLDRVSLLSGAVGVGIIGLLFLVGLKLIDRGIVRRVNRMVAVTQRVGEGDLSSRIPVVAKPALGRDEIDALVDDFNAMVGKVEKATGELRAASQMKSTFIHVASHELRSPVAYITGMAHLMQNVHDEQKLRRAVTAMGDKADRLASIVKSMLQLSPERHSPMQYARVNLAELLNRVRDGLEMAAEQRRQRIVVQAPGAIFIQADPDKLHDVFENLMTNALKFTPDGGTIQVRAVEQLGGQVTVAVRDQGPGIATAELPFIFEPFFAGGQLLQHSTGAGFQKRGMGLGLAVARHFVQLHGGSVHLTTTPSGSTFTVTLPIEPSGAFAQAGEYTI